MDEELVVFEKIIVGAKTMHQSLHMISTRSMCVSK